MSHSVMDLGTPDAKDKLFFSVYILQNYDQQPCHTLHTWLFSKRDTPILYFCLIHLSTNK